MWKWLFASFILLLYLLEASMSPGSRQEVARIVTGLVVSLKMLSFS